MTKEAAHSDRPGEVGVFPSFISRSQIVRPAAAIVSDRRLKEVVSEVHDIATRVGPRPDYIIYVIAGSAGAALQGLP
jgi:hypothetical protein